MESCLKNNTDQDIATLFCMPQVLIELMEECLDGASVDELAEIVLRDAALAARVLSAANKVDSASLNSLEPVSSAVQKLGTAVLATLALQAARDIVRYRFTPQELSFQYALWYSAQVAGVFARCLAPSVNYPRIEEAQLCGLLLNLGIQVLFFRDREAYLKLGVRPWNNSAQCRLEIENYATDHVQLADELINQWQLESFLPDAVRFLYADVSQLGQCNLLLKIARLVQQLSENPQELTAESIALAEQLFGLRQSEITYLFDWAKGLFPAFGRYLNDSSVLQAELTADLQRLSELSFLLADQEAVRARLAGGKDLDELLAVARNLYLENTPVTDAIFFLLDQKSHQLTGIAAPGQSHLIGEVTIPLVAGSNLAATALLESEPKDSFQLESSLTVSDQVLIRLCRSTGLCCLPLLLGDRKLGVVALGVDRAVDVRTSRFALLSPLVSRALEGMSNRVDEYFVESTSLLRRVSHEVSGSLTVIGNYAGVLNQALDGEENRDMAGSIKNEVRRIDDILNYYLNQQELPDFPEHRIDLNHLLRDTVAALENSEINPRQIKIQYELQNGLNKIATNPLLVKQVLTNLIKNAAEAVAQGGTIRLMTRDGHASDQGRYIEIIVQDDGPGIAPEVRSRLFKPVTSTKGAGHSGVGLSIVKGMVDDLGGRISCHSSASSGTSFYIQLPDSEE